MWYTLLLSKLKFDADNWKIEVGDQQHDSHEFYLGLLDKLHGRIHGGEGDHCKCFVHRTFYGSLRDTLICGSCKHNKTTRNPICDLALDISTSALSNGNVRNKRTLDLATCLQNFVAPEQLEGRIGVKESPAYACSNCGAEGKVTKKLEIRRLPPILCIQFKVNILLGAHNRLNLMLTAKSDFVGLRTRQRRSKIMSNFLLALIWHLLRFEPRTI